MRRCTKGKSCGGTCISREAKCRASLTPKLSHQVENLQGSLAGKVAKNGETNPLVKDLIDALALGPKATVNASSDFPSLKREAERQLAELRNKEYMTDEEIDRATKVEKALFDTWVKHTRADRPAIQERQNALEFDTEFTPTLKLGGSYDWKQSYESGSKGLGSGLYGAVIASKPPPSVVVKRGEVGENEVRILEKLSGKDITPKLISAEMNKSAEFNNAGYYPGRIAMSRVKGKPAEDFDSYESPVGNTTVGDSYYALRKKLHEQGVAHNDAHVGNVIIDDKGKARFVDFGVSQDDPRAALSEAIGVLSVRYLLPPGAMLRKPLNENSGDFQARDNKQFYLPPSATATSKGTTPQTNLGKIIRNRIKVYTEMEKLGLNKDDIAEVVTHSLDQPLSSYNKGAWGKIGKDDAARLISILYEGVS